MLENSKAYYCAGWKNGCKFTLWKNSLERYGVPMTDKLVKELLTDKTVKKIPVIKAQTGEKCTADIIYNKEKNIMELMNMSVIE